MKNYLVELILEPRLPQGKYIGRRYITIKLPADNEIDAGNFAKESIEVLLISNVLVIVNKVLES